MPTLIRLLLLGCLTWPFANAYAEKVYMTSLDWPPYSGSDLPEQGAVIAVAKAAMKEMGHELIVEFYPWSRAVALVRDSGSKYVAYLPEYFSEDFEFLLSDSLGSGPLGLVENIKNPLSWQQIDDLSAYRIGVVQDYVNTPEFDERMAAGTIPTESVTADVQNIKKVGVGRIDAAVIDANVLRYLLEHEASLADTAEQVRMNDRLLDNKSLHAAFRNDAEGQRWLEIFNQGIERIDAPALLKERLSQ
jgi:polar amino acid transport system substrate-binding protein